MILDYINELLKKKIYSPFHLYKCKTELYFSESMLPTGSVLEVESFVEKTEIGEIDEIFLVTLSEAEVKIGKSGKNSFTTLEI